MTRLDEVRVQIIGPIFGRRIFSLPRSIILLLLYFLLATSVSAQDAQPDLDSSVDYSFGEALHFFLSADNAADVERITLSFRPELSTDMYVVDIPFETSNTFSLTHTIDVARINLKPYSRVSYSWRLETDEGSWNLPERSFVYEDDRFLWRETKRNGATAHWTSNEPSIGQDALDVVNDVLLNLSTVLAIENISPIDVYIYPSSADLRTALESIGLDGEETTHPELDVILVTAVNPQSAAADLGQSIPDELAQLLIYRIAGENYETIPWWLKQGLGAIFQTRPNPNLAQILDEAVENEGTIPLWQLCEAPPDSGDRAMLARAQSLSLVEYIRSRFGDERLAELVRSYARGSDCQSGLQQSLDLTLDQLHAAWLAEQRTLSAPVQFLNDFGLWILILLAGFGFAWVVIRQSTKGINEG